MNAPFPYFGGKSRVAADVWKKLGDVKHYVEPFFGSGAVLLARPHFDPQNPQLETVNDMDGHLTNVWRSIKLAPDEVAYYCDWPVNQLDLHARRDVLMAVEPDLTERLRAQADYYDAKLAGWWVWGISQWIGDGFIGEKSKKIPHLSDTGKGIHAKGQIPHLSNSGMGIFHRLSHRLRRVRITCGDWSVICADSIMTTRGYLTGVFLDPPYVASSRRGGIYRHDSKTVGHDVREWALKMGENPKVRIAFCDYESEHDMPGWSVFQWKAQGGYGNQINGQANENADRERIWFSPHCLSGGEQMGLAL